ncbi:DHHW family protein [Winogradskyella poriferorum]|uniref:DHHW family protein n=1 Tax=Winogradskyella poriferorum TaxID=307627 RepID=UPI003D6566F1
MKENAIPHSVIEGKDGWYYLGNYYSNTLNDHFGNDNFSNIELEKIKQNLLKLDSYFKSQNIKYCIVVPPNKNTIYPEYLPFQLNKKKTKLDVLKVYLKNSDIPFIDLTQTLKKHKDSIILYYKTDSHWNSYGAYLGYKKIMDHISNQIEINSLSLDDYILEKKHEKYGDLTSLLKLRIKEENIRLVNEDLNSNYNKRDEFLSFINDKNNSSKLLMFRDSFANDLIPFFNDTFAETTYIKYYNIKEKVLKEKQPDFIIIEVVERDLRKLLKIKSPL